jgi:acetyl esterase/lipase
MPLAIAMSALSVFLTICILVPAPTRSLMPFTVATPELAQWVMLIDLVSLAVAIRFWRPGVILALGSLGVAAWPVIEALRMHAPPAGIYRRLDTGHIAPESLPLKILFYRPVGDQAHPVLIDIYGGSWQRGTPASDEAFNRYMAGRGYAVFAIDYRHSPQVIFPAHLEDVRAALAFVYANAGRYGGDPNRIAFCGRSAGGQLALLAAYEPGPVPVRAVISLYGPTNLTRGYAELPSPDPIDVRLTLATYLGGSPAQVPERYLAASPFTLANRRVPPTLLIQGQRDHVVKPEFARALYEKLRASGNQASLLEIPWAEHSFDEVLSGLGNQLALRKIESFLDATMPPK